MKTTDELLNELSSYGDVTLFSRDKYTHHPHQKLIDMLYAGEIKFPCKLEAKTKENFYKTFLIENINDFVNILGLYAESTICVTQSVAFSKGVKIMGVKNDT